LYGACMTHFLWPKRFYNIIDHYSIPASRYYTDYLPSGYKRNNLYNYIFYSSDREKKMKFLSKNFRPGRVNATDQRHVVVNQTSVGQAIINDRTDVTERRRRRRHCKSKVCAIFFFNENINNLRSRYATWTDSIYLL